MEKFTHGIVVVIPSQADENGVPIVHFVGYWDKPTIVDVEGVMDEMETDENFGLIEEAKAGLLEYYPANPEIIEYYNNQIIDEIET